VTDSLFIGLSDQDAPQSLVLKRANRHGLIAGATGTGKTVTLQGLAEGFARAGVPVFLADVKGDIAGMARAGSEAAAWTGKRALELKMEDYDWEAMPVVFWDLFGEQGHPIRTTISEMGPLLLSRLMGLNDTQEGVLTIAFRYADDHDMLLLDLEDLQAMLAWMAENAGELSARYGNVTKASVGSIQRQLLTLENEGGAAFFGEPAFEISDFIALDGKGRGRVNILAADKLMQSPRLYATFLLWLLSELFETLPEVGDPDKPKLVFFFDEAHLLFDEAPDALMDKVEQVVRLIRSKGVGVYFVTQNPIDIPEKIAGQLGNRVQHALRAFTPRDARAIRSAAETFRPNPRLDVAAVITEMKVGEALVSTLMPDGAPSPVERTRIAPPRSRVGPLTPGERMDVINASPFAGKYEERVDRESAAELLVMKREESAAQAAADKEAALQAKLDAQAAKEQAKVQAAREREAARLELARARAAERAAARPSATQKALEAAARSAASSIGRQVAGSLGKSLVRGILGSLFK
jgi:DNA helicase HerA-like ATPase